MKTPSVSIVLPLFKTEIFITDLVFQLSGALQDECIEIVGVDDASPDQSGVLLKEACRKCNIPCLLIAHQLNQGQNRTVVEGIEATSGETIVVMDADLQDPPAVVPKLIDTLRVQRKQICFGKRMGKSSTSWNLLTSKIFKWALFGALKSEFPPEIGLFFAASKSIRTQLESEKIKPPYVMAFLANMDLTWTTYSFKREKRVFGQSSYTFSHRLGLAARAFKYALNKRLTRKTQNSDQK